MRRRNSSAQTIMLGSIFAGLLASSLWGEVLAQQTPAAAPAPLPSGSPLIGQPNTSEAKKLAPVAPPPIPTAADKLPVGKLTVPAGFKIEVYASGAGNARSLALGDKGTVFAGSRLLDKVYAIADKDGKREVKVIATGLYRPNGIAFHNGTLYIAELSQISKIDNIESQLDNPPKPTVIYSDLPKDEAHGWKYLRVGPDNKLYFQIGAPCNICMPDDQHAQIRRINLDGSGAEVIARGIRQVVGMDWQPGTNLLYFSENQRDWLSEDIPQDKLNRLSNPGKDNFGFPYCHQGNFTDPEFGWGHSCTEFTKPVGLMGPHTAVLGMRFYNGAMFPDMKDAIILARHGSWNRSVKIGGDVVVVRLNEDGTVKSYDPLVTGFLQDNNYVGRPVDVLVLKDGSVLVSDDWNGAIWRISKA